MKPTECEDCGEDNADNLNCEVCGADVCELCMDTHLEDYHGSGEGDL
jgi:hypothetical protein